MTLPRCLCVAFLAAALPGCGDSSGRIPVEGKVTLNGQLLEGAVVTFYREGGVGVPEGSGRTGPDGKYTLTGAKGVRGLSPGEYRVVVSRRLRPDGSPPPPDVPPIESDARETLPDVYSSPTAGTLRRTVSNETKTYDLALEQPGKQ